MSNARVPQIGTLEPTKNVATDSVIIQPGKEELDPQRYRRRRRRIELALAWVAPLLLILAWEASARSEVVNPRYFPAPSDVWSELVRLARDGDLQKHLWISIRRVLLGFSLGVVVGGVVGMMMGLSRKARAALDGLLTALYMVPKLALLPLLLLIFGLGEKPKVIMVAITVFFFMWLTTMAAFSGTPAGYDEAAKSFGATRLQQLRHVRIPAALPDIFVAVPRLSIGVAVLVIVSTEFVQSSDGIGWLIWNSWSLLASERMYAGIVAVSVTGVVLTLLIRLLGRLLLPWARATDARANSPF